MKKKRRIWLAAAALLLCFSGCGAVQEEPAYRWAAEKEDIAKVPYALSGEGDGFQILCRVRTAEEEEKEQMLQRMEIQRSTVEENYRVHHVMSEEQYRLLCDQYDRQEREIREQDVYLSTITGSYTGSRKLPSGMLSYQLRDGEGRLLVGGAVDTRSLDGLWYSSENTAGEYFTNFFIPALEDGRMILQTEGSKTEIRLTLETEKM